MKSCELVVSIKKGGRGAAVREKRQQRVRVSSSVFVCDVVVSLCRSMLESVQGCKGAHTVIVLCDHDEHEQLLEVV